MVKPFGRIFAAFGLEHLERLIERDARRDRALDLRGVELLEAVERARLGRGLERGKGGELHELARRGRSRRNP